MKFLKGMYDLLEREIKKAHKIEKPKNISNKLKKELKKLKIYDKTDLIEIKEPKKNIIKVDYISVKNSPEYKKKFKSWRDTQFKFTLYFDKGLFVWDYINIHKILRGKGLGSTLVKFCERLAKDLGIKRFSVEWPNRKYWSKRIYEYI